MKVIGLDVPKQEQKPSLPVVEETKEEKKEIPPIPEKRGRGRPKKTI